MTRRMHQPTAAYETLLVYYANACKDREALLELVQTTYVELNVQGRGHRKRIREATHVLLDDIAKRGKAEGRPEGWPHNVAAKGGP